jgi:hypothetical protein
MTERNELMSVLACTDVGIKPKFEKCKGDDPATFVVSRNLQRRHLNGSQRTDVAAALAELQLSIRQSGESSQRAIGLTIKEKRAKQWLGHSAIAASISQYSSIEEVLGQDNSANLPTSREPIQGQFTLGLTR